MAQRKFLKPIVGGAIGLGILGIAGAVFAAGETVTITASGTGSGTSTGAVVYADSTLTCAADGDAGNVTELGWYNNATGTGSPLEAVTTGSGTTLSDALGAVITKGDTVYCVPTFASAATNTDNVTVVNAPPAATGITLSATGAGGTATCSWVYDDADIGDAQSAATVNWYYVSSGTATSGGTLSGTSTVTTATSATIDLDVDGSGSGIPSVSGGGSLLCEVTLTDDDSGTPLAGSASESGAETVPDTAPTATGVSVSPAAPRGTDSISCGYTYADVDGDTEGASTFKWFVGGVEVGGVTSSSTTPGALSASTGDEIDCEVTPVNTLSSGTARKASDDSATVNVNTPGEPDSVTVTASGTGQVGDTLTCGWSFTDADTESQAYATAEWFVNGVSATTSANVGTATSSTILASAIGAARGSTVYCLVSASELVSGVGATTADSSGTLLTIVDTPPVASGVSVSTTSPALTDTITCNYTYTDADNVVDGAVDAESGTSFEWVAGGSTSSYTASSGAVGADIGATTGQTLVCKVTPSNAGGSGTQVTSSNTANVANTAGTFSAGPSVSISGSGQTTDTATCSWTFSDPVDGDPQAVAEVEWYVGSAGSPSLTTSIGDATSTDSVTARALGATGGETINCSVTASDVDLVTDQITADTTASPVTVVDTPPVASGVNLDDITPDVSDTVNCSYSYTDEDNVTDALVDTESGTTIAWIVGSTTSGHTGSSAAIDGDLSAVKTDTVKCAVTPSNGSASGTQVVSTNTATVANSAPDTPSAPTISTTGGANGTATCTWTFSDPDTTDTTQSSASVAWYKNGSNVTTTTVSGSALTETINLSSTTGADINLVTGGDELTCAVTVNDGAADSAQSSQSSLVTVDNSKPTASGTTITESGGANGTATCSWTYADADGDLQAGFNIDWFYKAPGAGSYSSASATSSGTSAATDTINLSSSTGGDINGVSGGGDIKCEVTVTDSIGASSDSPGLSGEVSIDNTAPSIHQSASQSVAGPLVSPTTIVTGDTVTCVAFIEEIDIETTSWSMAWTDSGGTTLTGGGGSATASGTVSAGTVPTSTATISRTVTSSIDNYFCTVIVTDTDGAVTVADSASRSNTAPDQPTVTLSSSSPKVDDSVTCTWTYNDSDGDTQTGTVVEWLVDGTSQASASFSGTSTSDAQTMRSISAFEGSSVVCQVTPSDGVDAGTAGVSSAATVDNTAPVVSGVSVIETVGGGSTPEVNDSITCDYTWSDADDSGSADTDTGTTFAWFVNGASTGITSETTTPAALGADHISAGDALTCQVTPSDGQDSGTAVLGSAATVDNTAPVATANIPAGTYISGSTVTCTASGQDDNAHAVTGTLEFFIGGTLKSTTTLTGFTGGSSAATSEAVSYTLVSGDGGGQLIECTATYTDAVGAITAASATVSGTNSVPGVSITSLAPSAAFATDTVTCIADVTDLDAQSLTIGRTWHSNSDTGTTLQTDTNVIWSSPGGATALTAVTGTYVVKSTDVLTDVYCVVTADDTSDVGTANASVSVGNTTPTVTAAVTSDTGGASTGSTLTCSATANDPDSQTLTYTIDWTQGGTSLLSSALATGTIAAPAGGTFSDTYVVQAVDVTAALPIVCEVDLDDGTATASISASMSVTNTPPSVSTPTLSPSPPTIAAPVSCSTVGTDIDSDTITYGFDWTYNTTALTTLSSSGTSDTATLDLAATGAPYAKGGTLRCTVTPSDSLGTGSSDFVDVVIANAPPSLSTASAASSDTELYADSSIISSYSVSDWIDPDVGDVKTLNYTVGRQVGGTGAITSLVGPFSVAAGSTTDTITPSTMVRGDIFSFDYTPFDGTDSGDTLPTVSLTVVNKPPPAPDSLTMTPIVNVDYATTSTAGTTARELKDDIICAASSTALDVDGDSVEYIYTWYKDDGDLSFDASLDTEIDSANILDHAGLTGNRLDGVAVGTVAGETYWCSALANDGFDDSTVSIETSHTIAVDCDVDDDTYESLAACGGLDCNDSEPEINPSVFETHLLGTVGDGIDQNCDGSDECYEDLDGDNFPSDPTDPGNTSPASGALCDGVTELTADTIVGLDADCDDNEPRVNPGEDEDTCDGLDNDCSNNGIPEGDEVDQDGDNIVACAVEAYDCDDYVSFSAMNEPSVWTSTWFGDAAVTGGCDCDDTDADVAPGFEEQCELVDPQVDTDCDGDFNTWKLIPIAGSNIYYKDKDSDGFGWKDDFAYFCNQPDEYYSANKEDCDDKNENINPLAAEICNDRDDDCDTQIDNDDYQDLGEASGCLGLFRDSDRDLYGDVDFSACLCPTDDGGEDTGENASLIIVQLGSEQYISRQGDCYDRNPDIYPGSGDDTGLAAYVGEEADYNDNFDSIPDRRFEVMDGHDNNCDGYVPLIELDCDSDGSFVKLPTDQIPDEVSRYDEVGLAPCWDTVAGLDPEEPQLDSDGQALDLPTINCAGQNLALECDPFTRLWVIDRDSLDDFNGGFRENRPGNIAHGDCDDICPDRFPSNGETCDGIDNDCSDYAPDSDDQTPYYADPYNPELPERLWGEMDRDGIPDGMDADKERIGTVTIEEFDLDQDGYIGCGDSIGSLREQVIPTSLSCTINGFDFDPYDDEEKEDCNNTCALTTPVATEACNGFADTCVGDTEGNDGDADDTIACGIGALNSGAELQEEVFVLTYFQDVEEDPSTGAAAPDSVNAQPQTGPGAVDTGWFLGSRRSSFDLVECDTTLMSEPLSVKDVSTIVPMLLPRAVPPSDIEDWELGPDDIVATDQLLKQHLNALVGDESVDQAVRELDDRLAGRLEDRDPLLDFCACVNGFESGERDCDEWRERGRCAVLRVSLSSTADEDIDLHVRENDCIAGYPEQVVTRSVWNPVRIQEARQRVVEWECLQLYGKTCSEIAATGTPDSINVGGASEDCDNLVDDDGDGLADCDDPECTTSECINTELGNTAATDWWLELGRHNVSVVTEGSLMGCWGDPTDGIDQIDATTGGDCDNNDPLATRYNPEGPGDLYGRFWDMELDCSTCLDGVDNNCDGQTDCADPGCAACFVGQGFGVGGGSDASCAQLGCSSTGLSRSQTLGGLAMAFLALGLVGAGRRRRKTAV